VLVRQDMYTGTVYTGRTSLRSQLADVWQHDRIWIGVILFGLAFIATAGTVGAYIYYFHG
jgi:hypothetical protein